MTTPLRALPLALILIAAPALGAWEELRRNDQVRLSIDPQSIRTRGDTVTFRYLVDFRETQFEMIERMGLANYIQLQSEAAGAD